MSEHGATKLDDLLGLMRVCRICEGLELGPNPIFQLSNETQILIAGQAPGRITHAKNRPFDDPSGDRLRKWMGIDRSTFYDDPRIGIFPMGLCFPGSGKGGDVPPRPECAAQWREPVMNELGKLKLIIVMGRYAIDWHAPQARKLTVADAVRMSTQENPKTVVLPHPSPRNMRWFKQNPWFEADVIPELQKDIADILL